MICKKNILPKKLCEKGFLFIIVLFLCCSCSAKEREDTDTLNYQYEYSNSVWNIAEKDGYYYTNCNGLVQVSSQDELNFAPLCANPDCKHDSDSCSARPDGGDSPLFAYGGKLYILQSEYDEKKDIYLKNLKEISADNFTYTTVATIDESTEGENQTFSAFLHRGSLYYISESAQSDYTTKVKVCKLDLRGDKKPEVLLEVSDRYSGGSMFACENKVFFRINSYDLSVLEGIEELNEETLEKVYGLCESSLYFYQTDNGKLEQIMLPEDVFVSGFCADGEFLYYTERKLQKMHKLDLQTGTDSVLCSLESSELNADLWCNEKYLFVWHYMELFGKSDAPYTVEVYDRTGFLVDEIELPVQKEHNYAGMPMGADEKYMLLYSRAENVIWVYDMEQIGSEGGQWEAVPLVVPGN